MVTFSNEEKKERKNAADEYQRWDKHAVNQLLLIESPSVGVRYWRKPLEPTILAFFSRRSLSFQMSILRQKYPE